jgi:secreted PhoX family phosphatase
MIVASGASFGVMPSQAIGSPFNALGTKQQHANSDELRVADGLAAHVVVSFGQPLGVDGPLGPEFFGYNNDWLCLFDQPAKNERILWVNHEYAHPLWVGGHEGSGRKTLAAIRQEKRAVGGSLLQLLERGGRWAIVPGASVNKRFCALYPTMAFTGPAAKTLGAATGTLGNCSGGKTPWETALSCEENYPNFNATGFAGAHAWSDVAEQAVDEAHFGWVVEIDPQGELPPKKHTALGRFEHEAACVAVGKTAKVVVYMGDDKQGGHFYKFISAASLTPSATRAEKSALLETGTLYVADVLAGRWLPLCLERSDALNKAAFTAASIAQLTRDAGRCVGGTPLNRPEGCAIDPRDGSVYLALSNGLLSGDVFGHIVRFIEKDPESETFDYEIFVAGGLDSGLACPDNICFDPRGNLLVACDVATDKVRRGSYERFGNNGLFVVPTRGAQKGSALQIASGPRDSELTGMTFDRNGDLFVSVQHPGEGTNSRTMPTSHWPDGSGADPRPAVVCIRGLK